MDAILNVLNPALVIGTIGLILDIVGVIVIFLCTSTKRIETEISYRIAQDTLERVTEWDEEVDEWKGAMPKWKQSVDRTRRRTRVGLLLVIAGFVLQLMANWL